MLDDVQMSRYMLDSGFQSQARVLNARRSLTGMIISVGGGGALRDGIAALGSPQEP